MCTYTGATIKKKTFSATAELLPAHDKSSPACGFSVAHAHVEARPDPTASALSPTTWGPDRMMTDWLMGDSHLTKCLSDWSQRLTWAPKEGWSGMPATLGPKRVNSFPGWSTWNPEADSPEHDPVRSKPLYICKQPWSSRTYQAPGRH